MNNQCIKYAKEYSVLYIEGDKKHNPDDIGLPQVCFDNLWNCALASNNNTEKEAILSPRFRAGSRYIKLGKYVGAIQTKDGTTIEILPKIYSAHEAEDNIGLCKDVFLRMLRHYPDAISRTFQKAPIESLRNFPILEIHIRGFLEEIESLLKDGLKREYIQNTGKYDYLKGKLIIQKQIIQDLTDRTKFICQSNIYSENIPLNRIIVSALEKILKITHSSNNRIKANNLIKSFNNISPSKNIEHDIQKAKQSNRLLNPYSHVIELIEHILRDYGLTAFSGSYVSYALLFPVERLFEKYIAYLFNRYSDSITHTQFSRYCLVEKHKGESIFKLKPDLFLEKKQGTQKRYLIIDTKWKSIEENNRKKNYNIDIKDLYQLYAYGKKFEYKLASCPKLVLVYPYSHIFKKPLDAFYYEKTDGIKLVVFPFDLSTPATYKQQIDRILANNI